MNLISEQSKRRHEFLDAAGKILLVTGINSLTIQNLASQLKISESAIRRYFTDKEVIIAAMLEQLASDMEKETRQMCSSE
jgi:AcrR family transcriptional regulator